MAPTLEEMLQALPEHHLRRTVAERWKLKLPPGGSRGDVLETLLGSMRSPARIETVVERLYGDLRRVLHHVVLQGGATTTSEVAERVFQGDLWRTKQSLEELRNYQLLHLAETGELQGTYPEYDVTVPADLQEPLRTALGLGPVETDDVEAPEPDTVHRSGFAPLRDAVACLHVAASDQLERTRDGDLKQRTLKTLAPLVTRDDADYLDRLVEALETLGVLSAAGGTLRVEDAAADAFLGVGPAEAQALLVAGVLETPVPGTSARTGDLLWVLPDLAEAGDGWLDAGAALKRLRLEGLRRDFQRWFAASTQEIRAFLETVAFWFALVDRGGPDRRSLRLSPLTRALLGLEDPPVAEPPRVVVSPDLEVHLFQEPPDPGRLRTLLRFTEPEHLGPASRFKLTKEALWEGLDRASVEDVLDALGDDVPGNVESTIRSWAAHLHKVDLERTWLVSVRDPDALDDLLANPDLADDLERIGPRHARALDPKSVGRYLAEAGLAAEAPDVPRRAGSSSGRRRVRFDEVLDRLADALDVGLPAWLGGSRFEDHYEP